MRRIVLLGTGTDVGKTWVGAALVGSFRQLGQLTLGLKPIESGIVPSTPTGETDAGRLAVGADAPSHCYAFEEPISPHLAARRAGQSIESARVLSWVQDHESNTAKQVAGEPEHDSPEAPSALPYAAPHIVSLVETAGGAFSPVSPQEVNADLAHILDPALWVLVAPDRLGVLHDVAATLLALKGRYRAPDFVVLSRPGPADSSTGTNALELEKVVWPLLGNAAPKHHEVSVVDHGDADVRELARRLLAALSAKAPC